MTHAPIDVFDNPERFLALELGIRRNWFVQRTLAVTLADFVSRNDIPLGRLPDIVFSLHHSKVVSQHTAWFAFCM
jgi:hypothetical protein